MRLISIIIFSVLLISCQSESNKSAQLIIPESALKPATPANYFETFKVENAGWGYKIFQDGKMMINQPHIPSIQGNKTFSSQFKAAVAAQLIVEKLNNNIFPPSISAAELDSLGLLD